MSSLKSLAGYVYHTRDQLHRRWSRFLHVSLCLPAALVACLFVSCREPDVEEDEPAMPHVVCSLPSVSTIDMNAPYGNTRMVVSNEAADEGSNYQFHWADGDEVGIFPERGTQVSFAISDDGDGRTTAIFDGGGWRLKKDMHYAAYYPLQPKIFLDPKEIPLDLTQLVQKGNGMKSSDRPAVMGILYSPACAPDSKRNLEFKFHHVVSVLHFRITIPVSGGYKAVRLVTDGQFITQAKLNCFAETGNIMSQATANELTLKLEDVSVSREGDDNYLDIFFPFIPVDLSGKTLRVEAVYESGFDFVAEARAIDFTQYDAGTFFNYSESEATFTPVVINYISQADEKRALNNPHKGWYHHYYNHSVVGGNLTKYSFDSSEVTRVDGHEFPCLDHLYVRLPWADFEPKEGEYDWHLIDELVETYGSMGYGISVRITCREVGASGQNVESIVPYTKDDATKLQYQDVYNIRHCSYRDGMIVSEGLTPRSSYKNCYFATPYWVVQKGAKGTLVCDVKDGNFSWVPDYNDEVFLTALRTFHEAFVDHCKGKPALREALRYIDIGSLGDGGDGYTSSSTDEVIPVDVVKTHFNLYADCYAAIPEVPLVALENAITFNRQYEPFWQGNPVDQNITELMNYAFQTKKIGLRNDSYMTSYYLWLDDASGFNYAIMRPYIFEEAYGLNRLIVHEQDVYENITSAGNWQGTDGNTEFTLTTRNGHHQVKGRDIFIESMRRTHPTYIGYQAKLSTYLNENPTFVTEAGNLAGYWLFPLKATLTASTLTVHWLNKGVAPCLYPYELRLHFVTADGTDHRVDIDDSGNRSWKPASVDMANQTTFQPTPDIPVSTYANDSYLTPDKGVTVETYSYSFPKAALSSGTKVYMELYDPNTERSIDVGLKENFLHRTVDGHIYIPIGSL